MALSEILCRLQIFWGRGEGLLNVLTFIKGIPKVTENRNALYEIYIDVYGGIFLPSLVR